MTCAEVNETFLGDKQEKTNPTTLRQNNLEKYCAALRRRDLYQSNCGRNLEKTPSRHHSIALYARVGRIAVCAKWRTVQAFSAIAESGEYDA
jgi:hypothetical protein